MAAAKSLTITARIPAALAKKLEAYSKITKRTRSWLIEDILDKYVDNEIAIAKFVQEGIGESRRVRSPRRGHAPDPSLHRQTQT
ncbi:MAG: ribbon-helix-helix domain-containing protein [Rhizomicrobium sp.]